MDLTKHELSFLESQNLSETDVFDARGMIGKHWKAEIREQGKVLALGSPCKKKSHRLRTRSGFCAQCDTSKIAYQNRYHSEGYVYIAGSYTAKLVKIGTTKDIGHRSRMLNQHRYGKMTDWDLLFYIKCLDAGKVEQSALNTLNKYMVSATYEKDGKSQKTRELLRCSFTLAINAVSKSLGNGKVSKQWMDPNWNRYDFT